MVTGGTGFIGSHLVEALVLKGASVIVPFRSHDPRSYFSTAHLADHVILTSGDLKDFSRIFDIMTKYEIEYVFHLGAQAIVTAAYHNPRETIITNVTGTTNILEAARVYGKIRGIVVASSDKAYGKTVHKYIESDPLCGDHPYEVSKSAEDLIAHSYYKTYKLPITVARFGNVYGEGDVNFNRIIPGIMESVLTRTTLHLRSDGSYIRDYIYVDDVVRGYMLLAKHIDRAIGEAYNFGSAESLSVLHVIRLTEKALRAKISYCVDNTAINEIPSQQLDYSKVAKAFGWEPKATMSHVLPKIKLWYKRYFK